MVNAFIVNGERAAWDHISRFAWFGRRADTMPAILSDLELLETALLQARAGIVRDMRLEGCTWQEIGDALGMSAQGAHKRYRTVTE